MKGVLINFENRSNVKQLVVEIEIPGVGCLYLTFHVDMPELDYVSIKILSIELDS